MTRPDDEYATFVDHPRFGRRPHITGLNPHATYDGGTFIHWHSPKGCRIPNTAILASVSRQTAATVPVTHYFDVKRKCRDCGRPFIFFAREQKHWYEELGFGLDSNCVRCVPCRKQQQGLARQRERYEELFHVPSRTTEENLEMADCCLSLIEARLFHGRQTERVRMLLNRIPAERDEATQSRYDALRVRLAAIETENDNQQPPIREGGDG